MRRKVLAEGRPQGQPMLHRSLAEMRGFGAYAVELRFAADASRKAVEASPASFQEAIAVGRDAAIETGAVQYYVTGEYGYAMA